MRDDNVFNRPMNEWTDAEIRAGFAVLGREIAVCEAAGDPGRARVWTAHAIVLAEHRDERRALALAIDDVLMDARPVFVELPGEPV
ncbi:hypothetical protein [Actinomadura xylanilytica]|uniref:hypothetical protein n=1 Tax=Actinomadura xylanilytica TaxID=887459 RepID=UPI00255B1286|nr:hypothetical protein [Actinomadura xylanilytica]MDL4772914.1 hypothetical protein [Actinomadura xylanilytica]